MNTYHVPAGGSLMPISGFLSNEDKRIMDNAVQTSGIVYSIVGVDCPCSMAINVRKKL